MTQNENPLQHLEDRAKDAFRNSSFSPERQGANLIRDYGAELAADLRTVEAAGGDTARYKTNYEKHVSAWIAATSRCASSFICGPSNFPVVQQRKRHDSERNRYNEFREWREKALESVARAARREAAALIDPVAEAEAKLERLEKAQEQMKRANQIIRSGKNVEMQLMEEGFSNRQISELLTPDYMGRIGFADYQLKNNNAEIRRMRGRVEELRQKAALAESKPQEEETVNGVRIERDREADRLRLHFEGKPDPAVIARLKSGGFRWSPTNAAWQRQLTANAEYAAKQIIASLPV